MYILLYIQFTLVFISVIQMKVALHSWVRSYQPDWHSAGL